MAYVRTTGNIAHQSTFEMQPDAVLSQANPTSATLYTVLATTRNVKLISMFAKVTWTVQPTPLEILVTIDGNPFVFYMDNPVSTTKYEANLESGNTPTTQYMSTVNLYSITRAGLGLEGRSVLVQARTTGGTVSNLSCTVRYARRTD